MKLRLLPLLLQFCLSIAATSASAQTPDVVGQWRSRGLEAAGPMHVTRAFTLTDTEWTVVFHAFGDAQGMQPLFTLNVGGIYVIGAASAKVSGAYDAVFPANHRHITADSDQGVAMFAGMGCRLNKGEETALIQRGCGFVPGLMNAMGEYDLVALKDGQLFFGDRSGDLTKLRPAFLTTYPLVRK